MSISRVLKTAHHNQVQVIRVIHIHYEDCEQLFNSYQVPHYAGLASFKYD